MFLSSVCPTILPMDVVTALSASIAPPEGTPEGKKAEEISPRKSTPRTLKEVGQQYPPDFCDFPVENCCL
jgi:hypothetical protein